MSPNKRQHILSLHVTLRLSEKAFSRVFWGILSREHGFLLKCFVSRFVFLHLTSSCQFLEPCCSETEFAKQRLACTVFWYDKILSLSQILLQVRLVTLNFSCYVMVVFCLIFPEFATCSLALQKHLVSFVVNGLSPSASLALNTLAPLFRLAEWSVFAQGHVTMISFFFRVRDIPLSFHSVDLICSAPIGPIHPIFVYTLR